MSTNLQDLKYSQTFQYKGGTAKFLSKDDKTGMAWIEYNGKTIRVNYNDLFGINSANEALQDKKDENLAGIDKRIASTQARYEEYCAKIEVAKQTCSFEYSRQDVFTKMMKKLLFGKKDKSELTGAKASEYNELEAQLKASTKIGDRASWDIFSLAISAADEAYYKHDLCLQRNLAEHIMG